MSEIKVFNADCFEILPTIPDNSIDLVLIDPPYNIGKDKKWDKWKKVSEYVEFMGQAFKEAERVLKPNGSMYFFHNDFMQIVELQNYINNNTSFEFKSFITWHKSNFRTPIWKNPTDKSNLRSWFNVCEYCLYYTFQDSTGLKEVKHNVENFKELREYSKKIHEFIGLSKKDIINKIGGRADHFFRYSSTQFELPTEDTYNELIKEFNIDNYKDFKEYTELRNMYDKKMEEYEELIEGYEASRYTHNLDKEHNNIWHSEEQNKKKIHSCQKPLDILKRIILTSTHEGDEVLDFFGGVMSTGVACIETNRNFIGVEKDKKHFEDGYKRLVEAKERKENIINE